MRNRGDRTYIVLVHVRNFVHSCIIIYISNVYDIHRRVRYVDVLHVAWAGAVGGNIHLARPQGEPGDSAASAHRDRQIESGSSHERDQCRGVNGPDNHGTWHPAPASAHNGPSAIVEWREAPRLILNPRPSPWLDPDPMSVAVGSPASCDMRGKPHGAILRNASPLAVIVKIFVADDVAGNVTSGLGAFFAVITRTAPIVESIQTSGMSHIERQRIRAGDARAFTRVQMEVAAASVGLAFSFTHGDVRGLAVRIDVEPVFTGPLHCEREIWRVDFEGVPALESPNPDTQRTLGELNLHGAVVKVQERYTGLT